jgi:hypothetical protein
MKINCLICGHTVDLRDAYDDYEGLIKCFACGGLLTIRTREGQVKWVEPSGNPENERSTVDHSMQYGL